MVKKEVQKQVRDFSNASGIVGVVFGILSIVFTLNNGIVLGIIGLAFSLVQNKRMRNRWSRAGIVLNIIGIILGVVFIIIALTVLPNYLAQLQNIPTGA